MKCMWVCFGAYAILTLSSPGKDLQRDVAAEFGVAGAIDLAHAPCAERAGKLECADTRTDLQRHCEADL